MIGGHQIDACRDRSPCHSASRSRAARIGGAHLNAVAPSGISSAAERQVVRAGLGGDRQPAARAASRSVAAPSADDRCTMCTRRAVLARQRDQQPIAATSARGRARSPDTSRTRADRAVGPARQRAPASRRAPSAAGRASAQDAAAPRADRLRSTSGNSSTPDGARKHLKPRTPARDERLELAARCPDDAAAERRRRRGTVRAPRRVWRRAPRTVGRRRDAVERHVDDRRDAAGGGGARRGLEPSHSVRPGSLTWTCVSTSPGMTTKRIRLDDFGRAGGVVPRAHAR